MNSARDCRRHAAECTRLSETAATPKLRSVFSSLSRSWSGVARHLDRLDEYEAGRAIACRRTLAQESRDAAVLFRRV